MSTDIARQPLGREAVSIAEAAGLLGLSRGTIRNMIRDGTLRTVAARRRRLIPLSAVRALLAGRDAAQQGACP